MRTISWADAGKARPIEAKHKAASVRKIVPCILRSSWFFELTVEMGLIRATGYFPRCLSKKPAISSNASLRLERYHRDNIARETGLHSPVATRRRRPGVACDERARYC